MNFKRTTKRFIYLLLLLFISYSLSAQYSDSTHIQDSMNTLALQEVVITANRFGSYRMNTSEAIEIIRSKAIEQYQLRTTSEALTNLPGVFVQKTNHGGGSPFLRGLTGNQTLLLIDGIRLSNATVRYGPNQYFSTIDVFGLENIEVLRGSGSVQYGSDAIGGVIHAVSRDIGFTEKAVWGSSLLTRIATQGMEQTVHTGVRYSHTKAAFRGGLSWRNFGDLVGGDTTGRQSPNAYRELDFDLKGKLLLSSSSILTLVFQQVHQSDVPVYHKVALENYALNQMDSQKRRLAYVRLNQKLKAGIWKSATITASMQQSEEGRESRKNESTLFRTENDRVRSLALSAEAVMSKGNIWTSNNGIEVYNDRVKSSRTDTDLPDGESVSKRGLYPDGATLTSLAAFTLHTFDLPKWILTSGARFNSFIIHVEDEAVGHTRLTPSAIVGNVAVLRKLSGSSNIFISANTGFRAPNIDDLGTLGIVDFRYETPNFDLKPEHSLQLQLGYKYQGSKLRGEFYLYRNALNNLIVRNRMQGDSIEGYPVYQKENIERAYIQGFETSWDYDLNRSWGFTANIAYTYGQNITKKEPVRRIPPVFGRLAVEYRRENGWCSIEWMAAGKQDRLANGDREDNRIPAGGTPGWNIYTISAGYTLRHFTLDLRLQNLLNKDYRYHGSGVNGYGRSAVLGVIVNI
ncbi:MAG: TonB-dependent receptor [Bacteroidales bacterium]|nr:TonB-dependent receptor [Bacteroidales bacterium]